MSSIFFLDITMSISQASIHSLSVLKAIYPANCQRLSISQEQKIKNKLLNRNNMQIQYFIYA